MKKHTLPRKDRRKAQQYRIASKQIQKGAVIVSSAFMISSIVAPIILTPKVAEATEGDATSAEISNQTHTQVVTQSETTADTKDSTTQNSTTESSAIETTTSSEVDNSTESSTSKSEDLTSPTIESEAESIADTSLIGPKEETFSVLPRSVNANAFIAEIAGFAQPVAAANDLYTSVMMAQAIIESGWGASSLSQAPNYNLFGIKGSYQGQSVYMDTWEYLNGQWVIKKEAFRKYPSFQQSFDDNAYVLKNTSFQAGVYYYSGAWKSRTNSYKDATAWLTGRYATDPSYGTKLNNIITTYNLTQYDSSTGGGNTGDGNTGGNTGGGDSGSNNGGGTTTQDVVYTVKSGDSLWALANQYGTSVANIKSWNNLSSDTIYVGQKLIVGKGTGTGGNNNGGSTGGNTGGGDSGSNNGGGTTTQDVIYTVKSGDSLWVLANQYGTSIANIKSWNNLSSDTIYIGQKLIVGKGTASGGNTGGSTGGNTDGNNSNGGNGGGTTTQDVVYTVKSGDSLWAIANQYGVSITNIRQWNNLSGDIIYPGQRLVVKNGGNNSGSSNNSNNNNGSGQTGKTHTVKSGDTLWGLAGTYGTSIQQIKQLNGLTSDTIYIGQKLKV